MIGAECLWEHRARRFAPLVILGWAALAYCNSFGAPLVFDGSNYLKDSEHIRDLTSLDELFEDAPTRPFGHFTFAVNYALGGYNLFSWHLTNLLIHVAAACAAFGILRRTFASPRLAERYGAAANRLALTIALIWVVHPLNTQSVTYLYQRLESQMGLFYLLTLYAFLRYCESGRNRWAATSLVCCVLGTTSKEVAVTAPLMVLWYDCVFVAPSWAELARRRGWFHVLLWGTLLVPAVLMIRAQQLNLYANAGILDVTRVTPQEYAVTQLAVIQIYLRLSLVPWPLNIDYSMFPVAKWPIDRWLPESIDWSAVTLPGVVVIGLLLLTIVAAWQRPALGYLGGWWFVILAPTSSIAPIVDMVFEHRTYLPLLAPLTADVLLVREAWAWFGRRWKVNPATIAACGAATTIIVVATLTAVTLRRNEDYRSELTLWADVARKVPSNARGRYNHGVYLQLAGDPASIDGAIMEYHEALRLKPDYREAFINLGNLAKWRGQLAEADYYFGEALRLEPNNTTTLFYLAQTAQERGDSMRQKFYLQQLLEIDPKYEDGLRMQRDLDAAATAGATGTASGSASGSSTAPLSDDSRP